MHAGCDRINERIRDYAIHVQDWDHSERAGFFHEWAQRFNREFWLNVPTPAIQIEAIRKRWIGTYLRTRNGFGLQHEITFNTRYLDRPLAEQLETCLHELLHEWQLLHGKPSSSHYHNVQFRSKAKSFGLIVDEGGHSLGVQPGPFTELLQKYEIDTSILPPPGEAPIKRRRGDSKLKKWSCGCTNIRAAVQVEARCLKCGKFFERAEALW